MARPGSKISIKGTRDADTINVVAAGVELNGNLRALDSNLIYQGLILKGDAGNDVINGGGGPDEIDGGSGDDTIDGGQGLDRLVGGAGNDRFYQLEALVFDTDQSDNVDPNEILGAHIDGGRGIDTLDYSAVDPTVGIAVTLDGGHITSFAYDGTATGSERWFAPDDQQWIDRDFRNLENLIGSEGNDIVWGNNLANEIRGGAGHDYVNGGPGDDRLYGGDGDDLMIGQVGNDLLIGDAGADIFMFDGLPSGASGHDAILDYEVDVDALVFSFTSTAPVWSPGDYNGTPSMVATYGSGYSVTVVGITDLADIDYQYAYTAY